jgi:hypothetical protein
VSGVCPTRIIPEKSVIVQTERDEFFVYHSKVIQLHIECGGKPERIEEFRGVKKVKLAPSCIGYTDAYYIASHQDYSLNYTITFRNTSWRVGELVGDITPATLDSMFPAQPKRSIAIPDLVTPYWQLDAAGHNSFSTVVSPLNMGISVTTMTLVVILSLCCCYCCRVRIARSIMSHEMRPPHIEGNYPEGRFEPPIVRRHASRQFDSGKEPPPYEVPEEKLEGEDTPIQTRMPTSPLLTRNTARILLNQAALENTKLESFTTRRHRRYESQVIQPVELKTLNSIQECEDPDLLPPVLGDLKLESFMTKGEPSKYKSDDGTYYPFLKV